jgi:hypothetical protein
VARYVWSLEAHHGFFISLLAVIRPGEQGAEADKFRPINHIIRVVRKPESARH